MITITYTHLLHLPLLLLTALSCFGHQLKQDMRPDEAAIHTRHNGPGLLLLSVLGCCLLMLWQQIEDNSVTLYMPVLNLSLRQQQVPCCLRKTHVLLG